MLARSMRILAALFWFVWTGVVIPGHTRGAIQLPGSTSSCCHANSQRAPIGSDKSSNPASHNCAVCAVAAKIGSESLPPADALKLPFAHRALVFHTAEAPALAPFLSFDTRGPPDSSTANL